MPLLFPLNRINIGGFGGPPLLQWFPESQAELFAWQQTIAAAMPAEAGTLAGNTINETRPGATAVCSITFAKAQTRTRTASESAMSAGSVRSIAEPLAALLGALNAAQVRSLGHTVAALDIARAGTVSRASVRSGSAKAVADAAAVSRSIPRIIASVVLSLTASSLRSILKASPAISGVFSALPSRSMATTRPAAIPSDSGAVSRLLAHASAATNKQVTATAGRSVPRSVTGTIVTWSTGTARSIAKASAAVSPASVGGYSRKVSRAAAAIEAISGAVATIIKGGSIFTRTVAANSASFVAASLRRIGRSPSSTSAAVSASTLRAEASSRSGSSQPTAGLISRSSGRASSALANRPSATPSRSFGRTFAAIGAQLSGLWTAVFRPGAVLPVPPVSLGARFEMQACSSSWSPTQPAGALFDSLIWIGVTLMNVSRTDFSMWRSDTPVLSFGPTLDSNNQPVDLTGATGLFTFSSGTSGGPGAVQFTKAIVVLDQTTHKGVFTVTLASADTATLSAGTYRFDVRVTLGAVTLTVAVGSVNLS